VTSPHLVAPLSAGDVVGTAVLTAGEEHVSVRLVAAGPLPQASVDWRLRHP
jgi:hypothetical protein